MLFQEGFCATTLSINRWPSNLIFPVFRPVFLYVRAELTLLITDLEGSFQQIYPNAIPPRRIVCSHSTLILQLSPFDFISLSPV
jgi:hypothetical protein